MYKKYLNNINDYINTIVDDSNESDIPNFLKWFKNKLLIHFKRKTPVNLFPNKWDIYYVNLWMNIWSEINKERPCIIYSIRKLNKWNNIVVIPIKWFYDKIDNKYQILLNPDTINNLWKKSLANLMSIREVSKKRLKWKIWIIDNTKLKQIDEKMKIILWF